MKHKLAKACGCSAKKRHVMELMETKGIPHVSEIRLVNYFDGFIRVSIVSTRWKSQLSWYKERPPFQLLLIFEELEMVNFC